MYDYSIGININDMKLLAQAFSSFFALFTTKPESRTTQYNEWLTEFELGIISKNKCPDCECSSLLPGPEGGGSKNYYCLRKTCGSGFNLVGPFGVQRITNKSPLSEDDAPQKERVLSIINMYNVQMVD